MPTTPPYLTLAEVATYLAISESTVRRLIAGGSLRARQFGIQWRIHRDDLAAYEEASVCRSRAARMVQ